METMSPSILQWILGATTLGFALFVTLGKSPVVSAVSLMTALFSTGMLFFTQEAYFIGVVQVLIYAGAIAVLFVFIVMLLDLKPVRVQVPGRRFVQVMAALVGLCFFGAATAGIFPLLANFSSWGVFSPVESLGAQEPLSISMRFLSKYMIPFQVTALLLLAAIMGVVVLGKKSFVLMKNKDKSQ